MNNEESSKLYCSQDTFNKIRELLPDIKGKAVDVAIPQTFMNREMRRKQNKAIRRALKARKRGRL